MMNTDKIEVVHNSVVEQPISIRYHVLNEAHEFTYPGSIISNNYALDR